MSHPRQHWSSPPAGWPPCCASAPSCYPSVQTCRQTARRQTARLQTARLERQTSPMDCGAEPGGAPQLGSEHGTAAVGGSLHSAVAADCLLVHACVAAVPWVLQRHVRNGEATRRASHHTAVQLSARSAHKPVRISRKQVSMCVVTSDN
jgi:hypothetical protein